MQKRSRVVLDNIRKGQESTYEKIQERNVCPFCGDALEEYHFQPKLKEGAHWIVTTNQWPYEHTKKHFLLIARRHVESLRDLDEAEALELMQHILWIERIEQNVSGALFIRSGEAAFNGGTVRHLHAQYIVPDIEDKNWNKIKVKLGSNK